MAFAIHSPTCDSTTDTHMFLSEAFYACARCLFGRECPLSSFKTQLKGHLYLLITLFPISSVFWTSALSMHTSRECLLHFIMFICLCPLSAVRQDKGSGSGLSSVMYHVTHGKDFLLLYVFQLCSFVFFLLRLSQNLHHDTVLCFYLLICKSLRIRAL